MEFKYKQNDYGKVIIQLQDKTPTTRSIFYIHDFYDKPENFEPFIEQLKMFNFYGVCFKMDQTENKYFNNEGVTLETFYNDIRDLLISLDLEEIYLMGNGIGAAIALKLSQDVKLNIIKIVLINPLVSKLSRVTKEKLRNFPGNVDQTYDLMHDLYLPDDEVFFRGKEGNTVLDSTRRFVYNHYMYKKIIFDFLSQTHLNEYRKIEKKNSIPTLVMACGSDHLYLSSEISSTYRNASDTVTTVELLASGHYPWRDEYNEFVEQVMRFLFTGDKLYTEKKLPPEYLYKYLADDIKEQFKEQFAKQLKEREDKEAEKLSKQVDLEEMYGAPAMTEEEVEYYMRFQTETLQASIENAKAYVKSIKDAENKGLDEDFITFDESQKSNIIYTTKEGYFAYHDGQGNNFYQLPDSRTWIPSKFNKKEEVQEEAKEA